MGDDGPIVRSVRSAWLKFALAALTAIVTFIVAVPARAAVSRCDARDDLVSKLSQLSPREDAPLSMMSSVGLAAPAVADEYAPGSLVTTRGAAPLCDRRGATMIAPAPQLQQTETTIDADLTADDVAQKALLPGLAQVSFEIDAPDPATVHAVPKVAPAAETGRSEHEMRVKGAPLGFASSLERPPRG